jgi:hypothetical protein
MPTTIVHPFMPRAHCRKCLSNRVSLRHHTDHGALVVTCTTCGHVGATECADVPRDTRRVGNRPRPVSELRTIELPDDPDDDDGDDDTGDDQGDDDHDAAVA